MRSVVSMVVKFQREYYRDPSHCKDESAGLDMGTVKIWPVRGFWIDIHSNFYRSINNGFGREQAQLGASPTGMNNFLRHFRVY